MMNQRGTTSLEFLFASVISFGLFAVVFFMTFTLSVVEITQYVTFAAARAQSAAHVDVNKQEQMARAKYQKLIQSEVLAPIYQNGWFVVSSPSELDVRSGQGRNFGNDYPAVGAPNREVFQGVRTRFQALILSTALPLLGSGSDGETEFETRIASIVLREPSQKECQKFMEDRVQMIWSAVEGGKFARFRKGSGLKTPWEDNGC